LAISGVAAISARKLVCKVMDTDLYRIEFSEHQNASPRQGNPQMPPLRREPSFVPRQPPDIQPPARPYPGRWRHCFHRSVRCAGRLTEWGLCGFGHDRNPASHCRRKRGDYYRSERPPESSAGRVDSAGNAFAVPPLTPNLYVPCKLWHNFGSKPIGMGCRHQPWKLAIKLRRARSNEHGQISSTIRCCEEHDLRLKLDEGGGT
jgi:hypothetical protein